MPGYKCFACEKHIVGSVANLTRHLRIIHALPQNGLKLRCGQNDCPRTFLSPWKLKRHMLAHHGTSCGEFDEQIEGAHSLKLIYRKVRTAKLLPLLHLPEATQM